MNITPTLIVKHRRRASIYVVVLGTSMLVTVIGLSALMATRIERRGCEGSNDFGAARLYAQSAIEMGYFWINNDPDWRDNFIAGVWIADQPIGTGTYSLEVTDPDDNNLKAEPNDLIVFVGTGVMGDARFKLEVTYAVSNGGYEVWGDSWRRVVE